MNIFSKELRVSRVTQLPFPTYPSPGPTLDMCPWPLRSILWWSLHPCLQRWGSLSGHIPKSRFSNRYVYCLKARQVRMRVTCWPSSPHTFISRTEKLSTFGTAGGAVDSRAHLTQTLPWKIPPSTEAVKMWSSEQFLTHTWQIPPTRVLIVLTAAEPQEANQ